MAKTTLTESRRPRAGETAIARIPPPEAGTVEYFDRDSPGLALRVSHGGRRTWTHMYRVDGRQRRRSLGTYPDVSLDAAREAWGDDRKMIKRGQDPGEERRRAAQQATAERAQMRTYAQAVSEYRRHYLDGERGVKSAARVEQTLLREAPDWHDRPAASITAREVGALLRSVRDDPHVDSRGREYASGRPGLANRLHSYLTTFFKWCARGDVAIVDASPLDGVPKPYGGEEARDVYYAPEQLGALWRAAGRLTPNERAFVRTLLLTGKRKGALAKMRWDERGDDGWWYPPQPRRRTGRRETKHNWPVPLPAAAHDELARAGRTDRCPYAFEGRHRAKPLSPGRPLQDKVRAASGVEDFMFHGVRHTVVTLMREELRLPTEVIDRYTDHSPRRGTGRAYDHGEGRDELHDAADAWGRYVRLVGRRHVWAAVSAHLAAEDVADADGRREEARRRRREFCALAQAGGEPWTRWVRSVARPPEDQKVVRINAS